MVKCKSCSEGLCENNYEKRRFCNDPSTCTCTCQEEAASTFWKSVGSIAMGTAAFAGGVVLTVSTGGLGLAGLAAVAGGGALTGVGATAVIHPVAKQLNGERMTGAEYVKDLAIGGTVGAVTGPIGAGGASATTSIASQVGTEGIKQGAVKLACRTAIGAVSGATASVIQEGIHTATDEKAEFSVVNVLKGAAIGAATGGVGHITSNVTDKVSNEVARSVTKVATDTAGTAVIDVTSQLIENGEVDGKRLALNIGARAATSAGYEAVAGATYKAHGGREALQDKLGDKEMLDKIEDAGDKEQVVQGKRFVENLDPNVAEKEVRYADGKDFASAKADHENLKRDWKQMKQENTNKITAVNEQIQQVRSDPSLTPEQQKSQMRQLEAQKTQLKNLHRTQEQQVVDMLNLHQQEVVEFLKPKMMGDQNVHALGKIDNAKIGQFAADLTNPNSNNNGERGLRRAIYDLKRNDDGTLRAKIVAVVDDHNYGGAPGYGEVKGPELNESMTYISLKETEEKEKKKKKKKE